MSSWKPNLAWIGEKLEFIRYFSKCQSKIWSMWCYKWDKVHDMFVLEVSMAFNGWRCKTVDSKPKVIRCHFIQLQGKNTECSVTGYCRNWKINHMVIYIGDLNKNFGFIVWIYTYKKYTCKGKKNLCCL